MINRMTNLIKESNTKEVLNFFLSKLNKKDIIAYGASTKGNIVLNHCEIDNKKIKYICDANPYKYDKFTPEVI